MPVRKYSRLSAARSDADLGTNGPPDVPLIHAESVPKVAGVHENIGLLNTFVF